MSGADTHAPTTSSEEAIPVDASKLAGNLDGFYVFAGVGGGAARFEGEWDSTIGVQLTPVTVSERHWLSLLGIDAGLSQYGSRSGGRAWLAPVVGTNRAAGMLGLSAGLSAEWDRTEPPLWGAAATLWWFGGIVPYVTVGQHQRIGRFAEFGVRLSLPALRLTRRGLL